MKRFNGIVSCSFALLALGLPFVGQASELDSETNAPQALVIKTDESGKALNVYSVHTAFDSNSAEETESVLGSLTEKHELKDVTSVDANSSELDQDSSTQAWRGHYRGGYWHRDWCGSSYYSYRRHQLRVYYHWQYSYRYRGYDWYFYRY